MIQRTGWKSEQIRVENRYIKRAKSDLLPVLKDEVFSRNNACYIVWRFCPEAFNPYLSPKCKDVAEMDAPGIIAAILGEQLSKVSLESIRIVVLTSGLLLLSIGSIYSKKLWRFHLTYVLHAVSMALLAVFFIITTLLEGIYFTLLLLGVAIFFAGFFQTLVLSPPLATQKRLIIGIVLLIIAGLILMFSYAFLLDQIR
jgi:hypothetical protein